MIDCISVENMRLSDAYTIANLVPSLELMYRAAYGVFKAVDWHGRIAFVHLTIPKDMPLLCPLIPRGVRLHAPVFL